MKQHRPPRELPPERFVTTEECAGILAEHPITVHNKSNPNHPDYDADHPKPVRGLKGSPNRWWLPDIYEYVGKLKERSADLDEERCEAKHQRLCDERERGAA